MAVIGQGHFAQAAVLPAIEQLDDVELTALFSGSDEKLSELGSRYGVRTLAHYDELDSLLARGIVDAVYIAVPNDLHAEMTLVAARHGVHVLCEKPMAPTEAECLQMIRACEQRRVKLMIAYRLHFQAANLVAIEIIRGGELGDPRIFNSTFSMQVPARYSTSASTASMRRAICSAPSRSRSRRSRRAVAILGSPRSTRHMRSRCGFHSNASRSSRAASAHTTVHTTS
jgi:predicted dehydrogenase